MRQLVSRAKKHLPEIKDDLALLEKLIVTYEEEVDRYGGGEK